MMANPLFNSMSNNQNSGILGFLKEVQDFQKTFQGNPQEEVQKLMNEGKITQAQFNEFAQIANQLVGMMPK